MELEHNQMRIYFGSDYRMNVEFEKELEAFLKQYGFSWWASGTEVGTGIRDIAFDMLNSPGHKTLGTVMEETARKENVGS